MSDRVIAYDIKDHILRITAALYRVTDLFHDEEPLKWSLRKNAMEIVDFLPEGEGEQARRQWKGAERAVNLIRSIQQKLALAEAGGFVSKLNFEVIAREYALILGHLESAQGSRETNIFEEVSLSLPPAPELHDVSAKQATRDAVIPQEGQVSGIRTDFAKKTPTVSSHMQKFRVGEDGKTNNGHMSISERQERILRELASGGWLGVSSFMPLFKGDFSEKTIQRDLNNLVMRGVLKAEGEKRWRRYALLKVSGEAQEGLRSPEKTLDKDTPSSFSGPLEPIVPSNPLESVRTQKERFPEGPSWI
ncbi:MAG: hypothetical protein A3C84_04385 [Candidatus Ryanbacteria bacterium RIFCSPHIGHO2_02_FULL_48_12]|uniref:HTH deoR-type domain-containing protein n=1 Tax=Candidatus Ryanbacteria bacterium RIFCSPHIGHO2_01_FULL_48_27 TaxID=1802115 RepID=A0A1G2G5H7_9BACT|nr:MAG: hypothetical protein A2756_00575 [Candidatus Ryanbacteria bacterium RIFCSPHIGHO2_01_FULL_48_27]OGZ48600.1 MAG: hypothetical protein A3C84_04385 [Candidatus Ryanbacteria bacterium RIFCSPHIGHO2_02_FULL_48_12]